MSDTAQKIAEIREDRKMSNRKKKIAEIREWHEGKMDSFPQFTVFEAVGVMLDEIDRIQQEYAEERAAHNAHLTELCELEKENRRLREERQKLIEGLRFYASMNKINGVSMVLGDYGQRARNILREIGVTVE